MEKLFEELFDLLEEYINELDDETVENSGQKRADNEVKAIDKYLEAVRKNNKNYEADEVKKAQEEGRVAREKYQRNQELRSQRQKRLEKKFDEFKERLLNKKPQTPAETQKAGSEHDNALLNQHLRKKLEKSLAASNECLDDIMEMIEEYING